MARQLIRQLAGDFDPGAFKDEYHKALKKLIDRKIEGEEVVEAEDEPAEAGAEVLDLMEALKRSVQEAKSGRKTGSKRPAKKTTRKKATARKSTKKTTKRKTTARRSKAS